MGVRVSQTQTGQGRSVLLALSDCAIFGLFALLGRRSHGDAAPAQDILVIAAPFALAWLATAPWMKLYNAALIAQPSAIARQTALTWLIAGPVGLALRSLAFGKEFKPAFAITTLLFNVLLLVTWRSGLALWLKRRLAP